MRYFAAVILINLATPGSCDLTELLSSHPEEIDNLNLNLTSGKLPGWLKGALYRVGPGLFEHGGRSVNAVVDGLAKVHGWVFEGDGTVKYTARMTPSYIYNKSMDDNFLAPYAVMGDVVPDFSMMEEMSVLMGNLENKDNANIAVWDLDNGKSVTLTTESPMMQQVQPKSLKYKRPYLSGAVAKLDSSRSPMYAATHYAKHTSGSSINYVLSMSKLPWEMSEVSYDFFEYFPAESGEVMTRKIGSIPFPMQDLRMLHQFGTTENFVVVPLWNFQFGPKSMTNMMYDMTHMCNCITFAYDKPMYFYVMSIATGDIFKFDLPPGRGVHIMNTFERINDKGEIELVMDAPATTDVHKIDLNKLCLFDVLKIPFMKQPDFMYKNMPWDTTIRRYTLNINTLKYSIQDFPKTWKPVDTMVEFPFVNPAYLGKEYCYSFLQSWQMSTDTMDLLKYDMCTKTSIQWHEDHKMVLEPVFAANPKPTSEDDGVVMAQVYDNSKFTTEFIVWDAKDLKILARFDNMVKVPLTIHGWWFADYLTL